MENNFGRFDISQIHNDIIKYYPLGIHWESPAYGTLKQVINLRDTLSKALDSLFENKNISKLKFTKLCENISSGLKTKVIENNLHLQPSYAGIIQVRSTQSEEFTINNTIHFYISILSKAYIIFGTKHVVVKEKNEKISMPKLHVISPIGVFADSFYKIEERIKIELPDYKFIPFKLALKKIPGYFNPGNPHYFGSIMEALFIPGFIETPKLIGDKNYGVRDSLC